MSDQKSTATDIKNRESNLFVNILYLILGMGAFHKKEGYGPSMEELGMLNGEMIDYSCRHAHTHIARAAMPHLKLY